MTGRGIVRAGAVGLVVGGLALAAPTVSAQPAHGDAPAASPGGLAEQLLGAWTGQWSSLDVEVRRGSVEVLIVRRPDADGLTGQFTFLEGAKARTARRPGAVDGDALSFPLVGGGEIRLRLEGETLTGEFTDVRGGLPAPQGRLHLTRAR
jgi:hypothetical protein